jgi:dTDP-glucose 4,6-dehydratase
MSKVLITGIAGFIGHHVAEHFLINSDHSIVGLDKLTYASNGYNRIRDAGYMDNPRVKLLSGDFSQPIAVGMMKELGDIDYILHMGAETHVDNSILNPEPFVVANVVGTMHMLEYARKLPSLKRFFYFSTDEVFGPANTSVAYKEWDRHNPTNPYAASKSAGEMLCLSYANTYKIPLCITRTMNNFGERQHPEKYIPKVIKSVLKGEMVTIHSNATKTKAGSRFYIHARNVASAMLFLLDKAEQREAYHITGEKEVDNLEMAQFISKVIGKELRYEMIDFHSSRPGHDLRYSLDGSRLSNMGWQMPKNFEESLTKTIEWYLANKEWLNW